MIKRHILRMKSKTVLNRVTTPVMPFVWSINPYRGCAHGCAFCYARGTHSYIGMRADDTFRTHLFVKEDAPAVLRRELSKGKWKGGSVAIGTATDPYQPLEKQQRITRGILEVLALYRIPATVTTRSPLVLRDIDLLQELNRYTRCSVNISVNTLDVNVWRAIEPESPHPKERFDTVGKLRAAGIDTGVFIAPVLPFLTDEQTVLESLLQSARKADASFISVSLLRLKPEVKTWFFAQLQNCFPDRVPLYRSLYAGTYVDERYAKSFREKLNPLLEQYGYGKTQLSAAAHDESDFLSDTRSPEQLSFAL